MQRKLYKFRFDGRWGSLNGLFTADTNSVSKIMGEEVFFGEVLGKHSEVFGPIEECDITLVDATPGTIEELEHTLGGGNVYGTIYDGTYCSLVGYNPFDYKNEIFEDE